MKRRNCLFTYIGNQSSITRVLQYLVVVSVCFHLLVWLVKHKTMTTRHWDPRGVELLVNWTFEWNNNHEKQSRCDLTLKWQSIDHVNRPNFPGGNRDLHLFIPNFVVVYEFSLRCRSPHGFNSTGCIKYGLSILHPLTTCPNFVFLPSSSFRQFDDAKVVAVRWHHPKPLPGAPPPLTVFGGPRDVYSWLSVPLRDVVVSHFVGNIMIC